MKKFRLLLPLLALAACGGPEMITPIDQTDFKPATKSDSETTDTDAKTDIVCKWWQVGCDQPSPDDNDDTDWDGPPHGYGYDSDTDIHDYTDIDNTDSDDPDLILSDLLVGTWSGEYQWDTNSNRLLAITFKANGNMDFIVNPYGPNRTDYRGYWQIFEGQLYMYNDRYSLQYIWSNLYIVPGQYFTFTASNQIGTMHMDFGSEPPQNGLVAEIYTFNEDNEDDIFFTSGISWLGGNLYFDHILWLLRYGDPTPDCHDWVYGVTDINFEGTKNFKVNDIKGFDRYGGSRCGNATDRFILDIYGSIKVPVGFSRIRFNNDRKEINDGAIMFINDYNGHNGVQGDLTEDHAVLCYADDWDVECINENQTEYDINGGATGGLFPIEFVFVEMDDDLYMNVEISQGSNKNFQKIKPQNLTYPTWW